MQYTCLILHNPKINHPISLNQHIKGPFKLNNKYLLIKNLKDNIPPETKKHILKNHKKEFDYQIDQNIIILNCEKYDLKPNSTEIIISISLPKAHIIHYTGNCVFDIPSIISSQNHKNLTILKEFKCKCILFPPQLNEYKKYGKGMKFIGMTDCQECEHTVEHKIKNEHFLIHKNTHLIKSNETINSIYIPIPLLLKTYIKTFTSIYQSNQPHTLIIYGTYGTGKNNLFNSLNILLNNQLNKTVYKRNELIKNDEQNIKDFVYEKIQEKEFNVVIVNTEKEINFYELGNVNVVRMNKPNRREIRRIINKELKESKKISTIRSTVRSKNDSIRSTNDSIHNNTLHNNTIHSNTLHSNTLHSNSKSFNLINALEGFNYYELFNLINKLKENKKSNIDSLIKTYTKYHKKKNIPLQITFKDIAGYTHIKHLLTTLFLKKTPFLPQPKSILLHGPPGCSKTLFINALSNQMDLNFFYISNKIKSKFVGESECNLIGVFEEAKRNGGIIFIDEIDSIGMDRECFGSVHDVSLINTLLMLMDGEVGSLEDEELEGDEESESEELEEDDTLEGEEGNTLEGNTLEDDTSAKNVSISLENKIHQINHSLNTLNIKNNIKKNKVFIFAATNKKHLLDKALLRPGRFDKIIEINLPTEKDRKEIFEYYLKNKKKNECCSICQLNIENNENNESENCTFDLNTLVDETEHFSGAEIMACVSEAREIFVCEIMKGSVCGGYDWTGIVLRGVEIVKQRK